MSENTIDRHLKVKSMPSLCFNKDDFVLNEFSVDKFVSECRKYASLDTMRDDLNIFHKILVTAMIELLNKDYADFVNLSSNLAGLDKSIKSLSMPLLNLKSEIEGTKSNLENTQQSVKNMFSERASVHCTKVLIHHLLIIEEGLEKINLLHLEENRTHNFENVETLERIAIAFNNVQFHMHKIVDSKNYSVKEEIVSSVAKNLEQQLQTVFLQSLSNDMYKPDLHKILRIYSYISQENKVEALFRSSVVRPVMKTMITQTNITKFGLEKVLNDILNFVPNICKDVLKMTRRANNDSTHTEIVPGYDFLTNAVWPEIIDAFQYVAPVYLYSLGDPQQFHQNYSSFMKFLDKFEHMCGTQSSVAKLRELTSYKEFLEKFNLDVYFQIRFQEIAGKFECNLRDERTLIEEKADSDLPYKLDVTVSLWRCITACWADSMFIPFLRKDFLRLTFQLLLRYNKYIHSYLKNQEEPRNERTYELALLIKDVESLVPEIQKFFCEVVKKKLECESFHGTVEAAVEEIIKFLNEIPAVATKLIVRVLVEKCTSHLKLIASIPQRFRKTNREIPSKPSPYVKLVLSPLTEFYVRTKSILPSEWCECLERQVTDEIMKQCVTLMRDVLTSIKKMEDSLKILKRARDKPAQNSGQFSSGTITDDDKIRRQLAIDVTYFEELILKSGFQVSDLKSFKELKDLVTSAERVSGFPSKQS